MSGFYAVDWSGASTNIGIDLLAAVLGAALPASVLAPLFLLAALVLPLPGASSRGNGGAARPFRRLPASGPAGRHRRFRSLSRPRGPEHPP